MDVLLLGYVNILIFYEIIKQNLAIIQHVGHSIFLIVNDLCPFKTSLF